MKIEGRYYEPSSSASHLAMLEGNSDGGIRIVVEDDILLVDFLSISDRLKGVPRKIKFKDGSVFETEFDNAVDRLFEMEKGFGSKLSKLETSWKTVAVLAVASIGLIYSIFTWGLPLFSAGAAYATPTIALTAIDDGALVTMDKLFFEESNLSDDEKQRLQKLFDEVIIVSDQVSPKPKLLFRDSPTIGANAFALPGGSIVFTDQIIKLSKNDDELAGVVAHEIGHVTHQHGLKQIYRVLGVGFMIAVIGGDSSQLIDEVVTQAALVQNFSYTRQFEEQADKNSVELMSKLNRDPYAFVNLLDRIVPPTKDEGSDTSWYSTHPGNKDRRKNIETTLKELGK